MNLIAFLLTFPKFTVMVVQAKGWRGKMAIKKSQITEVRERNVINEMEVHRSLTGC